MTTDNSLTLSRSFSVERSSLYQMFSNPELLASWWGPKGFTNTFSTFEFRAGGDWIFVMHDPDGRGYDNHSIFDEIVENEKIVIRHVCAPKYTLTVLFEDTPTGTLLTWYSEFEDPKFLAGARDFLIEKNNENFDRLESGVHSSVCK